MEHREGIMSRVVACIAVLTILIGSDGPAFALGKNQVLFKDLALHCFIEEHVLHKSPEKNMLCHPVDWWRHNFARKKQPPDTLGGW
jgi:hypothetical protein